MSLRVLHITRTALTVDTFLRPLLAEHQARGHHVELAFGRSSNEPVDFGVPVHRYPIERSIRPDRFLMAVRGLKRIIRQGRYDVIVAHMALVGVAARIAFALAGRPGRMVYASHGLPCYLTRNRTARLDRPATGTGAQPLDRRHDRSQQLRLPHGHQVQTGAAQRDRSTSSTPWGYRTTTSWQRPQPSTVVPTDRALASPRIVPVIVYAGRFIKAKGVQVFLEIARRMAGGGVKAQFVIAGSGPLEGFVQAVH